MNAVRIGLAADQVLQPWICTSRPECAFMILTASFSRSASRLRILVMMPPLAIRLMAIAQDHAKGRILSMLEGGYQPGALARSIERHLNALLT